jgi:hypothetical protein
MELNASPDKSPDNQSPSLSPIQEKVASSLAAGATITGAAEESGLHRATIYRWLKTHPGFIAAVQQARTEFVLSRRDDLHYLSNRAMETLLAILDNPRSAPAVLLRASMFILQRSQTPGKGWFLPEPLPQPDGPTLTDSAVLENESSRLAALDAFEPEPVEEPASTASDATECDTSQRETENATVAPPAPPEPCEAPYNLGILPSCPIPIAVLERRNFRLHVLDTIDELKTAGKSGSGSVSESDFIPREIL